MASTSKPDAQTDTPSVPAAEPFPQVPEPKPGPTGRTAPHWSAGLVADVKTFGSAVDPFTGATVTRDDLPDGL